MTDIALRDTDGWTDVLPAVGDLAAKIAGTEFVPDSMRGKPAVVAAAILYGRELSLPPMTALRSIHVIKGTPSLKPEAMRAMVLAAGHDLRFDEMTSSRCVITGRRKGQEQSTTVTYTMDDAKRAGLAGQQQYQKMPRQMLAARATAELCRLIFADVIGGLMADVEVDDIEAMEPAPAPTTTIRRKRAATAPSAAADAPEPAPAPVDTPVDPEPVLDDDIVEAEIVEDDPEPTPSADDEAVALVQDELGAEVIEERPTQARGAALAREALAQSREPDAKITDAQMRALQAGFKEVGITDRAERLRIARGFAQRDSLASASELTVAEASAVLEALAMAKTSADPLAIIEEALR